METTSISPLVNCWVLMEWPAEKYLNIIFLKKAIDIARIEIAIAKYDRRNRNS